VQMVREVAFDVPGVTMWRETRESHGDTPSIARQASPAAPMRTPAGEKVGRNEPCPCGSGKKYKKCCYLKQGS